MAILTKDAENALNDARRTVKRVAADVQHRVDDATETVAHQVRRQPLKSVGYAACAGTFTGVLIGLALGRLVAARR